MEPLCNQTTDNQTKPKVMSFFPLQKMKGIQPIKTPAIWVTHLEQDGVEKQECAKSDDPDWIKGVTEEFIVHLAQTVKEAQQDEKCCYHCSSLEHFIHECPLMKSSKTATHLNQKEGMALEKEAWTPLSRWPSQSTPGRDAQGIGHCTQTLFLNPNPLHQWYGIKNVAQVRVYGQSCMPLLDNSTQINTITPNLVESHSLKVGPLSDLVCRWATCVGLGNALNQPTDYVVIWIQVDRVQGYDEDQIALVIPDLSNFVARVPIILGTPMLSHIMNVIKEKEIDTVAMPWVNVWVAYLLAVRQATPKVEDDKAVAGESNPHEYDEIVATKDTETIDAF